MGLLNDIASDRGPSGPTRKPVRVAGVQDTKGQGGIFGQVAANRGGGSLGTRGQQSNELKAGARVNRDFKALQEQRPEEVEDWQSIARITVQLGAAAGEDEEAKKMRDSLIWSYGDQLRPHLDAIDDTWWDKNWTKPEEPDLPWWQDGLKAIQPGLEYLDQWGQSSLSAIAGVRGAINKDDGISVGQGLKHAAKQALQATDVTRVFAGSPVTLTGFLGDKEDRGVIKLDDGKVAVLDQNKTGDLDLYEALGKDTTDNPLALDVAAFIGQMLTDPTTYVTLGQGGMAKTAIRGVEETAQRMARESVERLVREGADEAAQAGARSMAADVRFITQRIKDRGWRTLTEPEQELFTGLLRETVETAAPNSRSIARRGVETSIDQRLAAVRNAGRSGMQFGGVTVLPTGRLSQALRKMGVTPQAVFGKVPREAGVLAPQVDEILDIMDEPSGIVDLADDVAETAQPNWQFSARRDEIFVATPDGRNIVIPRSQLDDLVSHLNDMEAAFLARNNPVILAALPSARRTVVRKLTVLDEWEAGPNGLVRWLQPEEVVEGGINPALEAGGRFAGRPDAQRFVRNEARRRGFPAQTAEGGINNPRVMDEALKNQELVPFGDRAPVRIDAPTAETNWRLLPEDAPLDRLDQRPALNAGPMPANWVSPAMRTKIDDLLSQVDAQRALPVGRATPALKAGAEPLTAAQRSIQKLADNLGYDIVSESIEKGWWGELMGVPAVARVVQAMSPRGLVRATFGSRAAQDLGRLLSNTRDNPELKDLIIRMGADMRRGGLARRSTKEFENQGAWEQFMNEALSSEAGFRAAQGSASPATRQLLTTMHTVRERIRELAIEGGANPEHLQDVWSYIPRVLSHSTLKDPQLLRRMEDATSGGLKLGGNRVAESFMQARTIADKLSNLFDVNEEAADILRRTGIGDPADLFETNPVAAFAARSQSAMRTASEVDLLEGITKMDFNGVPLAFKALPDEVGTIGTVRSIVDGKVSGAGGKVADYRPVTLENGAVYQVHRIVADEMENVRRVFGDPKQVDALGRFFDKANNVWAASATVGFLNPAFHMRNHVGNMFNSFLAGVRNPLVFQRAIEAQRRYSDIISTMRKTGDSFDDTVKSMIDAGDLTPEMSRILDLARKENILGDGRSLDMLRERAGSGSANVSSGGSRLKPWHEDTVVNIPGRFVGERVENHARLGVFIDQLDKGASPAAAGIHVKKFLFDYGDLTRFEAEKLRRVSRFYTFTRKNTALQAYALAHYPGRVANAQAIIEGAVGAAAGEPGEDRFVPEWMMGAAIGSLDGEDVAFKLDTPFNSFADTLNILMQPPSDDLIVRLQTQDYIKGALGRTGQLFSGVLPATLDYIDGLRTGRDSFSGRELDPHDSDHLRDNQLWRGAATLFPALSRIETVASRAGLTRDGEEDQKLALQMFNLFTGVQARRLTDEGDDIARQTLMAETQNILEELAQRGIDAPTVDELRESGDLQFRNRVVESLMYGWETDEATGEMRWSQAVTDDRLLNIVPKDVREALRLPEPTSTSAVPKGGRPEAAEDSAEAQAHADFDFGQALDAIETYLGRELGEDERWAMVSTFPGGMGLEAQELAGLEPVRENKLLDPEKSQAREDARTQHKTAVFNDRLAAVGMSWDGVLARYPRVSTAERNISQARQAGWSDDEIRQALYFAKDEDGKGWTSRADRAAINQLRGYDRMNGPIPLTEFRTVTVTDEDIQKLQTKVWQAAEELRFIYQFEGWGTPSENDLFMYGANQLTKGEQRSLGIDPLKGAPNREDTRSDAQVASDSRRKLQGGVLPGLSSPYRWAPNAQPEFEPWEQE